jgi:hypothetical protein
VTWAVVTVWVTVRATKWRFSVAITVLWAEVGPWVVAIAIAIAKVVAIAKTGLTVVATELADGSPVLGNRGTDRACGSGSADYHEPGGGDCRNLSVSGLQPSKYFFATQSGLG